MPSPLKFSAARLLYLCFHRPKTWLQDRRDAAAGHRGEIAMRAAAAAPPPQSLPNWGLTGPPCRFLTGARFVHQTLFCARSFEWACHTQVRVEIFSDGTLTPAHLTTLKRALPHALIEESDTTEARLNHFLPVDRFPILRRMRTRHPLMRKLIDLHVGFEGPALYLDSDMLFFNAPLVLRDWLRHPTNEFFMQQHGDALVGQREQLEITFAHPLLRGVNSGIIAVDDRGFDWPALEIAAARLTDAEQEHPWAEQTLFAWHLSKRHATPLSAIDYFLCNSRADLGPNPPPLRHYVHKSKSLYAAREWRLWLERSQRPAQNQI